MSILFFPILGSTIVLIFIFCSRYKVTNLKEVRKFYTALRKNSSKPLIICSNHLTLIDSIIIEWALASTWHYIFHFKDLPWNLPATETVEANLNRRIVAYFGKCILINRKGDKRHHNFVLDQALKFLKNREPLLIFPEGTRSRTGKIDIKNMKYGVGKIIQQLLPDCDVLAVYVKNHKYKKFSNYPPRHSHFTVHTHLFQPGTNHKGLRGQKELTAQIMKKLKSFEDSV